MGATSGQDALMRMCTETVYADNPFHLLNLPTTATPRQIRRRREDLEGAWELGPSAWEEAFDHILGSRPIPTKEEVEEAFAKLEDPESRLLAEFFWVWPLGEEDPALKAFQERDSGVAFEVWERAVLEFGRSRPIAQHNLAVAYQMYAVDAETQAIDYKRTISDTFTRTMLKYWEKAFRYWEALADNDDFWELFEARMREFDDPRLTGGFIRRLRQTFPIAFDNINLALAVRYVKAGKLSEARRHVDYMRRTMSGLDNVEQNFSALFASIEKRLTLLTEQYDEKVSKDPLAGKECFLALLQQAQTFAALANGLLADEDPIRIQILTSIFRSANRYLIAYGNEGAIWPECLALNAKLEPFACTDQLKEIHEKNRKVLEENVRIYREEHPERCPLCGQELNEENLSHASVHLYRNVEYKGKNQFSYQKAKLEIACCRDCAISVDSFFNSICIFDYPLRPFYYPRLINRDPEEVSKEEEKIKTQLSNLPNIKESLKEGWQIGEGPSQKEMKEILDEKETQRIFLFWIIFFIIVLLGSILSN